MTLISYKYLSEARQISGGKLFFQNISSQIDYVPRLTEEAIATLTPMFLLQRIGAITPTPPALALAPQAGPRPPH